MVFVGMAIGKISVILDRDLEDLPADYMWFKKLEFNRATFLTRPEIVEAKILVRGECNKVANDMLLFQIPVVKTSKLDDFEQVQSMTTSQVGFSNQLPITMVLVNNQTEILFFSRLN